MSYFQAFVNLNDKPFKEPGKYVGCIEEITGLAARNRGFVNGVTIDRLLSDGVEYYHFVGSFETLGAARRFQTQLFSKEYVGQVAIQRSEDTVMKRAPQELLKLRAAARRTV
jgi:hypothetical protein